MSTYEHFNVQVILKDAHEVDLFLWRYLPTEYRQISRHKSSHLIQAPKGTSVESLYETLIDALERMFRAYQENDDFGYVSQAYDAYKAAAPNSCVFKVEPIQVSDALLQDWYDVETKISELQKDMRDLQERRKAIIHSLISE